MLGLDMIVTYLKPDISRLKFRSLTAGLQVAVATAFCKVVLIFVGHFMVLDSCHHSGAWNFGGKICPPLFSATVLSAENRPDETSLLGNVVTS
jgi:hypothetical protein